MFEFVRAYGAFANGGYVVQPYAIERIEDSRGRVLYRASKTKSSHQLSLKTAAEMTAMMKTVIISGTGTGANIGKPAAGKTGTTDDYKDAYFVGYTPDIVTGVWVGDDNNKKINGLYGGTLPAKIWKEVMTVATRDLGARDFDYPEIELENYSGGYGNAKIIGDEENPSNEGKEVVQPEPKAEEAQKQEETPAATQPKETTTAPATENKSTAPSAPVPTKPTNKMTPIPMAVPESLR